MADIITYKDKVDLVLDTTTADEYKWSAADANQVKVGINGLGTVTETDLPTYNYRTDIIASYAKMYVDATRRRCEVLFDVSTKSVSSPFVGDTHHPILSIPPLYTPRLSIIYGWGTAGTYGFVQVRAEKASASVGIWLINSAPSVRGGLIWYF